MKNKLILSILFAVILISSLGFSSAWIVPDTHDYIGHQAVLQASGSTYGQIVAAHFDDFSACMSATDYSVFFYFSSGFSTIGKQYLASHNNVICSRALELADKNNPSEVACALGICGMDAMDSPSHNGFVPSVITRTGLVNGLVHAPAEECVNKKITTSQLLTEGQSALINKYPVHRDFLIKVFQSDTRTSSIDVGKMMDAFVAEVANSKTYSVGFRGFTAIPFSIHLVLLLYFLFGMITLSFLIKRKNKSKKTKISMLLLLLLVIIPVIIIYVLFFTGTLWKGFQAAITPICWVLPIDGYQAYINQAVSNTANLFNNGAAAMLQIPDPAGMQALANADAGNAWILWLVGLIFVGLIALFIYLNFRKRRNK
jgi:hypothetical protein